MISADQKLAKDVSYKKKEEKNDIDRSEVRDILWE